jgi:prephenate dehydrogenase
VLLAVPVAATEATFKAIRHLVTPTMLIMDVGSTKRDVVDAARRVLREQIRGFVPAHPIAGQARSPASSTPTPTCTPASRSS